jgi:hypothetical protein
VVATSIFLFMNSSALSQLGPPECTGCKDEGSGTPSYGARAHCAQTGSTGVGKGFTREEAARYAIQDCVNRGGSRSCCRVVQTYDLP